MSIAVGAQDNPAAFAQLLTVDDTGVIDKAALDDDLREKIALFGPDGGDAGALRALPIGLSGLGCLPPRRAGCAALLQA